MSISQVISYLEGLVAGLKEGKICVRQGEQFVTLSPDQRADVEIKASTKKGKEKLEIELAWHPGQEPQEMSISNSEPEQSDQDRDPLPAVSAPAIEVQASTQDFDPELGMQSEADPEPDQEKKDLK